ncbi:YqgF/RNase H-like protein [Gracilaria domingensis]|nr:YqgF/RNase H-like protein [Gracilaria domingensis]
MDVGTRHIGLALSDDARLVSFPHSAFRRRSVLSDVQRLRLLARESQVSCAVVGMPRAPHGAECRALQEFVRLYSHRVLGESGFRAIAYWDECFTTVIAKDEFMSSAKKGERNNSALRKRRVDAGAAALILQDVLDAMKLLSDDEG